jgi:hypothetical protein
LRAVKKATKEFRESKDRLGQLLPFRVRKDPPDRRGQRAQTLPFPDPLESKAQKGTKGTPETRGQPEQTQQFPDQKATKVFKESKAFRAKLGPPDPLEPIQLFRVRRVSAAFRVSKVFPAKLAQLGQPEKLDQPDRKGHRVFRVSKAKLGQPEALGPRVRPERLDPRATPGKLELFPLPLPLLMTQKLEPFPLLLLP